jgi:8-oxo-dGTP pyrophosphatase MutT (NUDIX family)
MPTSSGSTLSALIPSGIFVGAGVFVIKDGRFLCGIRPLRKEGGALTAQLTAIGGGVEKSDPTILAAVLREAREEINCSICFATCIETLLVLGPKQSEWRQLTDPVGPAAVVFRNYCTPPREPWYIPHRGRQCLVLYTGAVVGAPQPSAELPGLIWLRPEQIVATAHQDLPLQELIDDGAELIEESRLSLARNALARLTDSQEALILALGQDAVSFYYRLSALCEKRYDY